MRKNVRYHYYVEGNCEKKLIDELKTTVTYIDEINTFIEAFQDCIEQLNFRS